MKDLSRGVKRLRRKIYRQLPVASSNRVAELDHRMSYADMRAALEGARLGISSGGAALALWRACTDRGLCAWCYEFGFRESLTQTVTIVDIEGVLEVHDAFFNSSYPRGLVDMLHALRDGTAATGKGKARDRKIYITDPGGEPEATVHWLEAHADRELDPVDGLRRFDLLWNSEAFTATYPAIERVFRELATRGYPEDLRFLMLHPVAVFDGKKWWRDPTEMPLLREQDLTSPVAAWRVAARQLETKQARVTELTETIARIEADLAHTNSCLSVASESFSAERETWLQQKVALQAGKTALEGELRETQARLSATINLRAQKDSQIAQLRAEIEDITRESDLQQNALITLEAERAGWEAARLWLETENLHLRTQLEAASQESEKLQQHAAVLKGRARAADDHMIEISHYLAPLLDEVRQLRRDYRAARLEREAISRDRQRLEAQLAASPGARLRALWRRLTQRRAPI